MTVVVPRSRLSGPWTIPVHVIWPNLNVLADENVVLPRGRSWQTWYATLQYNFKSLTPSERQLKQELPWFFLERENISIIIRDAWKGQIFLGDSIPQRGIGNSLNDTTLES